MFSKKFLFALGAAALTFPALALPPGAAITKDIYIAGSSAADNLLDAGLTDQCDPATVDLYNDNNSAASLGADFHNISCNIKLGGALGLPAGTSVMFHKISKGGSGTGGGAVCNGGTANSFMNVTVADCLSAGPNTYTCNTAGVPALLVPHVSEVGITDVSPAELNPGITTCNTKPLLNLNFGIAVTEKLYRALQISQHLDETSDNAANMPSLSQDVIRSIFTGRIQNWTDLKRNGVPLKNYSYVDGGGVTHTVTPPISGTAVSGADQVSFCRRSNGSGTTRVTTLTMGFGAAGCIGSSLGMQSQQLAGGPGYVATNASTDFLSQCLDDLNTAGKPSGPSDSNITYSANPRASNWAIGYISTDNNTARTKGWRFIRVNGVLPTIENTANGTYPMYGTIHAHQSANATVLAAVSPESTALFNTLQSVFSVARAAAFNTASATHLWGTAGATVPTVVVNGPVPQPFTIGTPVTNWVHSASTGASVVINHCLNYEAIPTFNGGPTGVGPADDNLVSGD